MKKRIFALLAFVIIFILINKIIAVTGLDKAKEDIFYSDVYSILNDILPGAKIPFANAPGGEERVNSLGFRGEETTWEKPVGAKRLVSLGDSSTFGIYCRVEETYTALIGEEAAKSGPWETLNCGIPGTNILQHRLLYELKLKRLGADIVMVYVVPNVRKDLETLRDLYDLSGRESGGAARRVQKYLRKMPLYRFFLHEIKGSVSKRIRNQVEVIYSEHRNEDENEYFARGFQKDLKELRFQIVSGGAQPVWIWHVTRKAVEQLYERKKSDAKWTFDPVVDEVHPYYSLMAKFANDHSDPLVNPYPAMIEARIEGRDLFFDVVHPTAAGHRVIAEAVLKVLEPLLLKSPGKDL